MTLKGGKINQMSSKENGDESNNNLSTPKEAIFYMCTKHICNLILHDHFPPSI